MKPTTLYKKLYSRFGSQHWWPAEKAFEVCVGAILTQNTSWKNAAKAIKELKKHKFLDTRKLAAARTEKIAAMIKSSGYYNQKAKKLKAFCSHLQKHYNGNLHKMLSKPLHELRAELLSLHGIGKETADSIALYAAEKPIFVIDAYTKRISERLGLAGKKTSQDYDLLQEFFESSLPRDARLFNEFHALLVRLGKDYCRKKPLCGECFLRNSCNSPFG